MAWGLAIVETPSHSQKVTVAVNGVGYRAMINNLFLPELEVVDMNDLWF